MAMAWHGGDRPGAHASPASAGRLGTIVRLLLMSIALLSLVLDRGAAIPTAWQLLPLAASVLVLGLPHGALDHLVEARLTGGALRLPGLLRFCAGYLALAGLVVGLWFVAPVAGLGFFIGLTVYHWGQGDLHGMLSLDGAAHLSRRRARVTALLLRGALPMLVPLLAFPGEFAVGAARLVALFDLPTVTLEASLRGPLQAPAFLTLMGLLGLHLLFVQPGRGLSATARAFVRRDALRDLRDLLLLTTFFATVPPTLAIGLYFCFWHAARHVARLVEIGPAVVEVRPLRRAWAQGRRFALDAAPLTLAALGLLVVQATLWPNRPSSAEAWAAGYLVWIAALTLPHALVVTRMDLAQGVWRPASATPSLESTGRREVPTPRAASVPAEARPSDLFTRFFALGR